MAHRGAGSAALAAAHWEPAWSSTHRRWFFQDRKNGTSTWSRPPGCSVELPKGPPGELQSDAGAAVQDLPPGWEAEWDPKHKMHYYFNRTTRERVWKKPQLSGTSAAATTMPAQPQRQERAGASAAASSSVPGLGVAGSPSAGPGGAAGVQGRFLDAPAPMPAAMARDTSGDSGLVSPRDYRAEPRTSNGWDPKTFLERLARAKATGYQDAVKAVRKEVAEHNYEIRHQWTVPRTRYMQADTCLKAKPPSFQDRQPIISFSEATTADAVQMLAVGPSKPRICALNFANGVKVGGGYKNGAIAQEEDLCRRIPSLFTSLFNAKRDGYYPFGPSTCSSPERPEKYSDVLWTPGVAVARANEAKGYALLPPDEQASVSLVAAAAPNVRFARPLEVKDVGLMYNTVKTIFLSPRMFEPEISTLVLGAWGCGAFGGDPHEVSELFCRALAKDDYGRLYKEVHFAIPKGGPEDVNADIFRDALRRHGIAFRELSPTSRG